VTPLPKSTVARARRAVATVVGALSMGLAALVVVPAAPAEAQTPTPPPQPALNALGGPGPCTSKTTSATNTAYSNQTVWVIEPQGAGSPTRTGGTCGTGIRPVVFMAHGWSRCSFEPSNPTNYQDLINNLVSNGFLVVYANYCSVNEYDFVGNGTPTYDMVNTGYVQAMGMTTREDTANIGFWGHSFGGGMVPWLAEQAWDRNWGGQSLWVAVYAPYVPLRGTLPDFDLPSHTRSLNVIFQHDQVCAQAGVPWPFCSVPAWSANIYNRMPQPESQQWGVHVKSDCSHPPVSGCNPPSELRLLADHYVPGSKTGGVVIRPDDHIKYYGIYRNVQALSDCARNSASPSCNVSRTSMGVWSDGVPATSATNCTPASCP
jgi:hypothetical protein